MVRVVVGLGLGRRENFFEGSEETWAEFGEDGPRHLFADPKSDHVDGVEQLEGQHLPLLPAAREHDSRARYQVPNWNGTRKDIQKN